MDFELQNPELEFNTPKEELNISQTQDLGFEFETNNDEMSVEPEIKELSFETPRVNPNPELEDLEITPTMEEQNFKSEMYGYDNVKVKAIESEELTVNPTKEQQAFSGLYDKVTVNPIESDTLNVTPTKERQSFNGLFDTVNINKIPDNYIIPTGNIDITENGIYDVTDKETATVNIESTGSQYPIIEGNGEHEVRFVDYDGTLIKIQYVNDGESATAPELPTHDRLTFVEWNRDYTNITHDLDVGALYEPTSGNTELFINVTEETGLGITLNISRSVSSGTITVNWGDGTASTFGTGTGAKALTHSYSSYGEYMISIITTVNYKLGGNTVELQLIRGNNEVNNFGALIKCYCSNKVTELTSYCCYNLYNLEEFTMISVTKMGVTSFTNTKQKAIIISKTTTQIGNRIAVYCGNLEYVIISDTPTSVSGPVTVSTKVKKLIYSTKYNNSATTYSYLAYFDSYEYVWYPKSTKNHAMATANGNYCMLLKYFPIYDNLTGITSSSFLYGCDIEKIALPPSVTTIANQTFYSCGNLKDIYIYTDTVPTLGGTSAFMSVNSLCKIHVKPELLSQFQTATNWSTSRIKNMLVGDLEGEFKDGYCE